MKILSAKRTHVPAYPNAAEPGYYWGKLLNGALTLVASFGAVTALMFILLL